MSEIFRLKINNIRAALKKKEDVKEKYREHVLVKQW